MTMKNRVTVTVRQDGREIVCTLSAVTVFFIYRKTFPPNHVLYKHFVLVIAESFFGETPNFLGSVSLEK